MRESAERAPGLTVHGWIARRVCEEKDQRKCYRLSAEAKSQTLTRFSKQVWKMGFHAVHLDLETVPDGDPDFIKILENLKGLRPKGKKLSLAGYSLVLDQKAKKEFTQKPKSDLKPLAWSKGYYGKILPLVDHVMVMNYDTALLSKEEYVGFTTWQTRHLIDLIPNQVNFRMGIPVYEFGRRGIFHAAIENLETSSKGIFGALKKCPKRFGVAIFNEREMQEKEWKRFEALWGPKT